MHLKSYSLVAAVWITGVVQVAAEPYLPEKGTQILEQLRERPLDTSARELRALRSSLTQAPTDVVLATRVARRYIEESRAKGDPRYLGYAQAALKPWWYQDKPPTNVLLLRATISQSNHDFDAALKDLSQLLKSSPENVQAWVTQATILQVKGEFGEAAKSCAALSTLSSTYGTICSAGLTALNGQAAQGYELLSGTLAQIPDTALDQKVWIETGLAEIASRLGWSARANEHFNRALQSGATDPYLKAAYADFLLDEGRPSEVIQLLREDLRIDALLLRLALAEQMLDSRELSVTIASLRSRFDSARLRGDRIHIREEARFVTSLLLLPAEGLILAQTNWTLQKEPADARILLEAALMANAPLAAEPVIKWVDKNKLEDVAIIKLIERLQR